MLHRLRARLRSLWNWHRQESELDQEIQFHLSEEADERVAAGLSPDEARRTAKKDFGNVHSIRARTRDVWIWPWLQDVGQDARFAARLLVKDRWLTLAAVTVLALGIGANTAVFTIVNSVFIRGLPFHEPDRILRLWTQTQDERGARRPPSELTYEHWAEARSLSGLAGHVGSSINVSDEDLAPERVQGSYVTANLFRVLGQVPMLGRDFAAEDDQPGAEPVAIIGHRVWQNRYGSDPAVLGRTLKANGQVVTIIGVMPPDMRFPDDADIWLPRAQLPPRTFPYSFEAIGRLADRVTLEQARVELESITQRLAQAFPETNANLASYVWPYYEWTVDGEEIGLLFLLLQGTVPFVLLIACANVANLLLARSAHRAHEIAVRVSLGASRGRVVRQLLVESVLLALIAGLAGLGVAVAGLRWAEAATQTMADMPHWMAFTMDGTVFAFVAAVCLATGIIFGLAPALHVSKTDVNEVLKEGDRSGTGGLRARRWTRVLIVSEIALTLVLLAGAGFMMRSFFTLYRMNLGVDTSPLLTMQLFLPVPKYREVGLRTELFRQFAERLAGIHEIEASTLTTRTPAGGGAWRRLMIDGRPRPIDEEPPLVLTVWVGDGYFETLGVPLLQGRAFTWGDGRPGQQSAIVNRQFVAMHFGNEEPIGRRIMVESDDFPPGTFESPWLTIVGVSPDVRQRQLGREDDGEDRGVVYVPYRTSSPRSGALILRTRGDPAAVTALVRDAMRNVEPDLPVFNIQTMDELLAQQRWPFRVFGTMFTTFALIALVLVAIGLYAVTAYSVTQRTQEIGLRVALGAQPGQIQWLVLGQAVRQLAIGLPIGLAGAFGVGQLLQGAPNGGLLLQASPSDPLTLVSIVAVLVGTAVLACLWPARCAARLDPMVALRHE